MTLTKAQSIERDRLFALGKKRCPNSGETKPLNEFYKNKSRQDGHASHCKICSSKAQRRYRETEHGQATQRQQRRRYRESDHGQAVERAYQQSEKGRATRAASKRRWRQTDKGRASELPSNERYRQSNKGRAGARIRQRRYRQTVAGREHRKCYQAIYTQTEVSRASQRAGGRRYRQTEKGRENRRRKQGRRRAQKARAEGSHSASQFLALCHATGFRCLACGHKFPLKGLAEDHVVPLFRGGSDDISNIQPLCKSCNSTKGTQTIDYRAGSWQMRPRLRQLDLSWQAAH